MIAATHQSLGLADAAEIRIDGPPRRTVADALEDMGVIRACLP